MRYVVGAVLLSAASLAACSPAQQQEPKTPPPADAVTALETELTRSIPAEHVDIATLRTELSHALPVDGVSILSAEMAYTLPQSTRPSKARVVAPTVVEPEPETKALQTWGYSEPEMDEASDEAEEPVD